jgi:hypothetical protein
MGLPSGRHLYGQLAAEPHRPGAASERPATHFTQPGTYFPVVRVTSQGDGDPTSPFELIQNLASVRVVVH